ncbi:MAG TPA: hypothetical protein VI932_06140 [Bacteroidota bacterium]|nr:hypothetical protein [Bacteroidota bacterium]
MIRFQILKSGREKLREGADGSYPVALVETTKTRTEVRHEIDEALTRPWVRHQFLNQALHASGEQDDQISFSRNLIILFKTTIPLPENAFTESRLSAWRMFLDSAFRDADTPWYRGTRKVLVKERFYTAIEQLELEVPESNPQKQLQFRDHHNTLRRLPRVPIKLLFSLPGNERETVCGILREALIANPHNIDIVLLTYAFFVAWDRGTDLLAIAQQEDRDDLKEWYYWVNNDMKSIGAMKRSSGEYLSLFFLYDRAGFGSAEYRDIADWLLRESEFKFSYHFYYKAKEFETALEILQNISPREFSELLNLRRTSAGERPVDLSADAARLELMYQEEIETLRGFARIRAAETYKQVAVKARQHFDRETIETKYAFGELTEDEYQRLIRQLQERMQ